MKTDTETCSKSTPVFEQNIMSENTVPYNGPCGLRRGSEAV